MSPAVRSALVSGGLAGLGLVAAWNAAWFFPGVVDDAWISLRYAWNLVHGEGLVFNPGEYAEGYSNPSWTLLGALYLWLGLDPIYALKWTGLLLAALFPALVYGAARRMEIPRGWAFLAALVPAANLELAAWATPGLETPLWVALLVATTTALGRRWIQGETRPWSAALLAGLYLTRPEAVLWLLAALLVEAGLAAARPARRPEALRWAGLLLLPVGAWLLFRRLAYGDWVANTYYVKAAGWEATRFFPSSLTSWAWRSSPILAALGLLALPLALFRPRLWPLLGSLGIQALFLVRAGTDWMAQNRLWAPVGPLVALLVVGVGAGLPARVRRVAAVVVGLAFLVQGAVHLRYEARYQGPHGRVSLIERQVGRKSVWGRLGGSIRSGVPQRVGEVLLHLEPGTRLAHTEIGLLAYATDHPIHDAFALVDRRLSGATGEALRDVVEEMPSDWILDKGGTPGLEVLKKTRWYRERGFAPRAKWGNITVIGPAEPRRLPPAQALARVEEAVRRVPRELVFQRLRVELAREAQDPRAEQFCAELRALVPEEGDCDRPSGLLGEDRPVAIAELALDGVGGAWTPMPADFTGVEPAPGEGPGGGAALRVRGEGAACTDWLPASGEVAVRGQVWVDELHSRGQGAVVTLRLRGRGGNRVEAVGAWLRPTPTWKEFAGRFPAAAGDEYRVCLGFRAGEGVVRFAALQAGRADAGGGEAAEEEPVAE